ncbi:hypothetical protein LTR94_027966, partial [Friedmanniomyces endolithicus]
MSRSLKTLALGSALTAAVGLAAMAAPASAQSVQPGAVQMMQPAPSLNLSAYGEVKAAPDMATITFGVQTEAATAQQAMRDNATRMTEVMTALRRAGISERDIQTSGLNLSAQYDYVQNEPPKLRGYQAVNRVTVVINDLTKVGTTADAVVAAGVNQIDGISFGLKDPTAAENQARQSAVRALQAKAQLYAQSLGVQLSGIRNLTEGGGYAPQPPQPMYAVRAMAMRDESTPVSAGELSIRVDITGVYDIA